MKIILCGSGGKMGHAVAEVVKKTDSFEIAAGIDPTHVENTGFPVFKSPEQVNFKADVIIDFSHPDNLTELLFLAQKFCIPLVIGTTGYSKIQFEELQKASNKISIFYSRNMSFGINLMLELSKIATRAFGTDFDIEIIEKHHRHKIDAPSGTALMLAEAISSCREETTYVFDRSKKRTSRTTEEIGIHSIRGGTDAGTHKVAFLGDGEVLAISHSAQSREIFARGALKAAEFLIGKPVGMYSMKNLLSGK